LALRALRFGFGAPAAEVLQAVLEGGDLEAGSRVGGQLLAA